MPFGQHEDTELQNNQFQETKILGLPVSRHMRALNWFAWRPEIKSMWMRSTKTLRTQSALEKLGKSKFGFERTVVSKFKSKRRVGSGNELVDYCRVPGLGTDQKAHGLWERDWLLTRCVKQISDIKLTSVADAILIKRQTFLSLFQWFVFRKFNNIIRMF